MRVLGMLVAISLVIGCGGSGTPPPAVDAGAHKDGSPSGGATRGGDQGGPLTGADGGPDGPATIKPDATADAPVVEPADAAPDAAPDVAVTEPDAAVDPAPDAEPDAEPGACAANGQCELFAADYRQAVVKAQSCSTLLKDQCNEQVANNLFCGCSVWVTDSAELDDIRKMANAVGCEKCRRVCPLLIACRALTAGVCRAKSGGLPLLTGVCADDSDPLE